MNKIGDGSIEKLEVTPRDRARTYEIRGKMEKYRENEQPLQDFQESTKEEETILVEEGDVVQMEFEKKEDSEDVKKEKKTTKKTTTKTTKK